MSFEVLPDDPLLESMWDEELQNQADVLGGKYAEYIKSPGSELCYRALKETVEQLPQNPRNRYIDRIKFTIEHLLRFSDGIATITQAQPNPFSLIWGCIDVILKLARNYIKIKETVADLLGQLTTCMTRLSEYTRFLPGRPRLIRLLREIVKEYVAFCLSCVDFSCGLVWKNKQSSQRVSVRTKLWNYHYIPKPVKKFIRTIAFPVYEKFQSTKDSIEHLVREFEREARVGMDEMQVEDHHMLHEMRATHCRSASGSLEYITMIPFARNDFFTGRDEELGRLHGHMMEARRNGKRGSCTINSMGGMGKTQLALEYAYRFRESYDCVFWIPCEHICAEGFASIGRRVSPLCPEDLPGLIEYTKTWLEVMCWRWLLIYDNVETWESIREFWPSGASGTIIITTQHKELVNLSYGNEIELQPFSDADGARLLLKHLRKAPPTKSELSSASEVANAVGGLPVALSHISGYIDKQCCTLTEFKEIYNASLKESGKVWSHRCATSTYQYSLTLETTWDLALQELPSNARALIDVLAMLDAESVSEEILFSPLVLQQYGHILQRSFIANLAERQLVRRHGTEGKCVWSIHRALQLSLLLRLDGTDSGLQGAFDIALDIVRLSFPRQSPCQAPSNDNWLANEACVAHALHLENVFRRSPTKIKPSREFVELLADVGNYRWECGLYKRGLSTLELAKTIHEDFLPDLFQIEHSKVCTLQCALHLEQGITEREKGTLMAFEAWKLRQNYVQTKSQPQEETSSEEWILLANSWNDIACCMLEYGCYEPAEKWINISIRIKKDHKIEEDSREACFNYAENYKNLAILRTAQNRHEEAVDMSRRAAELIGRHMPSGAVAQSFRFHLAYTLYQASALGEAHEIHQSVRQQRRLIFGPQNVHTLNSYYACAVVLQQMGKVEEADKLLSYCLARGIDTTWNSNYVDRIRFRLSELRGTTGPSPASSLVEQYVPKYQVSKGPGSVKMVIYDQMVAIDGGRSTTGQFRVLLSDLRRTFPVVNEVELLAQVYP